MSNEIVIFCESYPQIKNALYLITENYCSHPTTVVITGHNDLLKFSKVINEKAFDNNINIVSFESFPAQMAGNSRKIIKMLYLIPDIIRERSYLRAIYEKYFARLVGADIYFCGRCFNPSSFYLLKRLSKVNRIIYMPDPTYDVVQVLKSTPNNIRELVIWFRFKAAYGHDLMISQFPYLRNIPTMPDSFFEKRVHRVIKQEERNKMLQDFDTSVFRVFDEGKCSVLYLDEDPVGGGYISDSEDFRNTMGNIFNTLKKHFPENSIARKYHPNFHGNRDLIKIGIILPDFIPAEFLYNDKIKVYLGLYSLALANVTKGTVVSLMYLFNFKNETSREQVKNEFLQWSHTNVLFPKSLDEFEKILIDINNHRLEEAK